MSRNPADLLPWLATLPDGDERFSICAAAGVTAADIYEALDAAPVGTTIALRHLGHDYVASQTEYGWGCYNLPPVYGIASHGFYRRFWRGVGFRLSSITLPKEPA